MRRQRMKIAQPVRPRGAPEALEDLHDPEVVLRLTAVVPGWVTLQARQHVRPVQADQLFPGGWLGIGRGAAEQLERVRAVGRLTIAVVLRLDADGDRERGDGHGSRIEGCGRFDGFERWHAHSIERGRAQERSKTDHDQAGSICGLSPRAPQEQ